MRAKNGIKVWHFVLDRPVVSLQEVSPDLEALGEGHNVWRVLEIPVLKHESRSENEKGTK